MDAKTKKLPESCEGCPQMKLCQGFLDAGLSEDDLLAWHTQLPQLLHEVEFADAAWGKLMESLARKFGAPTLYLISRLYQSRFSGFLTDLDEGLDADSLKGLDVIADVLVAEYKEQTDADVEEITV